MKMKHLTLTDIPCLKPLERVVKLLGRRWTIPLIMLLGNSRDSLRYSEIRDYLVKHQGREISDSLFSRKLLELTDLGILVRKSFDEIPPHVEYDLSEVGRGLVDILHKLGEWTREQCHVGGLEIPDRNKAD